MINLNQIGSLRNCFCGRIIDRDCISTKHISKLLIKIINEGILLTSVVYSTKINHRGVWDQIIKSNAKAPLPR